MHNVALYTKDGNKHPLALSSKGLRDLKNKLGLILYNEQGQLVSHPVAELVVQDDKGSILLRLKAVDLQPFIIHE